VLIIEILRESRVDSEEDDESMVLNRSIFLLSGDSIDDYRQERIISMALELFEADSGLEIIHLSLGAPMLGPRPPTLLEYSLPSSRMGSEMWGGLLSEQISLLLIAHRPAIFLYDGEYPHRGIIRALRDRPNQLSIWVEPSVEDSSIHHRDSGGAFDHHVVPSDPFIDHLMTPKEVKLVPPLFRANQSQRGMMKVRRELDISSDATVVFFHPPRRPSKRQTSVFKSLLSRLSKERVILCMNPAEFSTERVGDYPRALIRSLATPMGGEWSSAIDFAVIDGSQSMILKMIDAEIPSISVPRLGVRDDVDHRRAEAASNAGCSLMIADAKTISPEWALRKMLNPIKRRRMRDSCRSVTLESGMQEFSTWLLDHLD